MVWKTETAYPKALRYVIEKEILRAIDGGSDMEGFYLYVYDGEKMIYDDLQDTLQFAKEIALEKFNVSIDSWMEA